MAKPSWATVSPSSGSGNGTLSISAGDYTGRVTRTGTVTVASTKDTTKKATVSISQSAKAEFVIIGSSSGTTIEANATLFVIPHYSNSKYILIKKTTGTFNVTLKYSAVRTSIANITTVLTPTTLSDGSILYTIPSDSGSSAEYALRIECAVTANETITAITRTFSVCGISGASAPTAYPSSPASGTQYTTNINQKPKVVTLSASPVSVTIPASGTAQTVNVTSNDAWSVS